MYEAIEYYDNNGLDLKIVLKSCIYKYYLLNRNSGVNLEKGFEMEEKNDIMCVANKVNVLSEERS